MANRANTVSVGVSGGERQIVNVKSGTANTDATTVSQLKGVANSIGGGAGVNADGTIKAPTFNLANGGTQTTVGGALNALDTATTRLNDAVKAATGAGSRYVKVNDGSGEVAGDAVATGTGSIAIGPATTAGNYATVIGQKTTAVDWSTAVGYQASASGKQSTAVGFGAHTNGNAEAIAVGSGAFGDGTGAVAVGRRTRAAQDGIATGNNAISNATDSIAVGRNATAGTKAADGAAGGTGAIAIGADSNANYLGNVAIGRGAAATQTSAVALGMDFDFDAKGNVTNAAVTYTPGTIASGSPQIVLNPGQGDSKYYVDGDRSKGKLPKGTIISNVADGKQNTDAANVGQVFDIVNSAVAGGANGAPHIDLRSMPRPASMALGAPAPTGSGVDTTGLTNAYKTAGYYSQATGLGNSVGSTPPSDMAHAAGQGSIAYGSNANAGADKSSALGVQAYTSASDSVALGAGSVANQANTVSVGSDGTGSYTAIDANGKPYTIQNAANTRRVVNMAAGQGDTDAVNVSQLKGVTDAIGGGAGVNADGTIKAPSFDLANGGKQTTVGGALSALDTATTKNATDLAGVKGDVTNITTNIANGTVGLVQQDPTSKQITVAKDNGAVNLAQLKSAGFDFDAKGNVTNAAVTYTAGTIASGSPRIVLSAGQGDSPYFVDGDRSKGKLPKGTIISNVANGKQDTDAANVGQVYDIMNQVDQGADDANAIQTRAMPGPVSVSKPSWWPANGSAGQGINLRAGADSSGVDVTALTKSYKTAAYYAQASGLGDSVGSTGPSDMARADGKGSIAYGSNAFASADKSAAVGVQAYTSAADSVALGAGSVANQANTVSVGSDGTGSYTAVDANGQTYTIQNGANTRRVVNMAAGHDDTDAVNVSQLKGVTSALGGGAAVNADGTIKAPTFAVQGGTQTTVADALGSLDTATTKNAGDIAKANGDISNVTNTINNITNGAAGLVQQDPTSKEITVAKDKDGTSVSIAGTAGNRTLTGLSDGVLSATSTDAVTGSQLYATNEAVKKNTGDIGSLSQKVDNINTNIGNVGNMVAYDNDQHDSLTLGGLKSDGKGGLVPATQPVKVSNVAAGTAASDATTVGQLSPLVDALGGGAKIDSATGAVTGPAYTVQGTTQTTVGGAVTALDSATTKNASDIVNVKNDVTTIANNITNGKTGLVQQDDATGAITVAKALSGDKVDFTGTDGTRELTGVSAGKTDSSAATVGQLRPVVDALGGGAAINPDGSIVAPTYSIQGKTEHTVGDAFKSVDDNLASLKTQIGNGGIGVVTQDAATGNGTAAARRAARRAWRRDTAALSRRRRRSGRAARRDSLRSPGRAANRPRARCRCPRRSTAAPAGRSCRSTASRARPSSSSRGARAWRRATRSRGSSRAAARRDSA